MAKGEYAKGCFSSCSIYRYQFNQGCMAVAELMSNPYLSVCVTQKERKMHTSRARYLFVICICLMRANMFLQVLRMLMHMF